MPVVNYLKEKLSTQLVIAIKTRQEKHPYFNQEVKESTVKIKHWRKTLNRSQTNGKVFCIHESELVLLGPILQKGSASVR